MKLSEDILSKFDLDPVVDHEPVNTMKVSEVLEFLGECTKRMVDKSEKYFSSEDMDVKVDCLDIVSFRLNDFVQSFMDLMVFFRKEENTLREGDHSLRYCIVSYDTFFENQSMEEKSFLEQLVIRNEITHDYYNREKHQQKLISIMQNNIKGAEYVCRHLEEFCEQRQYMDKMIDRNQ